MSNTAASRWKQRGPCPLQPRRQRRSLRRPRSWGLRRPGSGAGASTEGDARAASPASQAMGGSHVARRARHHAQPSLPARPARVCVPAWAMPSLTHGSGGKFTAPPPAPRPPAYSCRAPASGPCVAALPSALAVSRTHVRIRPRPNTHDFDFLWSGQKLRSGQLEILRVSTATEFVQKMGLFSECQ